MENEVEPLDSQIGGRVHQLRRVQGLSLDDLAAKSGVSRAMISRIERGEVSPTAVLLNRLCTAFDLSLSSFFGGNQQAAGSPLSRRDSQPVWIDPDSGYRRCAVSPTGTGSPVDIVDIEFPAGATVRLPPMEANRGLTQHLWLLEGTLEMRVGKVTYLLTPGDCLFMDISEALTFHNPGPKATRYAIIYNSTKLPVSPNPRGVDTVGDKND